MEPKTSAHGTTSGYSAGCRCEACRAARAEYMRAYIQSTPERREKNRERSLRYYEANKEKRSEKMRQWREENAEKKRELDRRYYQVNREKLREQNRRWKEANPERKRELDKRSRENSGLRWRNHGITSDQAEAMWLAQGKVCAGCGEPAERKEVLHVDHDHGCCSGVFSAGDCIRGLVCQSCNRRDVLAIGA
jgi:hypothetical protein